MARIAFHSIEATAVDGYDDTVQVDQIVLAQWFRILPEPGGACDQRTSSGRATGGAERTPKTFPSATSC